MREITYDQWEAEARQLFGDDPMQWRFKCPSCGHEASAAVYRKAGAPEGAVGFSCVGRWVGADDANTFKNSGGPCQYAGGGLFGLNPVTVTLPSGKKISAFEFGAPIEVQS